MIEVKIIVRGGTGGDGVVRFRHEKYIPLGGPDGGNGGFGGSVFLKASSKVADIGLLKKKKGLAAENGDRGDGQCKHGKKGKDLTILVPLGTMVFVEVGGKERLMADLITEGGGILVAKGGRGGLGNARFATAANQTPEIATEGEHGEEQHLTLKLKLLTDICIIGLPNSGKSALLAAISHAKPQIAPYPFSTREAVLGVIQSKSSDFVVAEIPALVEGAHVGKGLGNEFLGHVERTKIIIYLLDGTSFTALRDLDKLSEELLLYNSDLLRKPKIVAVNKVDLPEVQARLPEIKRSLSRMDAPVFYISAATGYGIAELIARAMEMLEEMRKVQETVLPSYVPPQLKGGVDEGHLTSLAIFRPKPRRAKR